MTHYTRICTNILPATGPVSAGGDQGRDFETFRTYLSESPTAGSSFVGLASREPVVFACTLTQRDRLEPKIKADVAVILGGGTPVASIYCLCSSDLPTSRRHELEQWAQDEHGVHLEILDGQAIAELLAAPDVFWIASRYLSIPLDIYPAAPASEEEEWYGRLRSRWWEPDCEPENFADFSELKSAVRHATWTESTKPDLPVWIGKLTTLRSTTAWTALQRRCTYEVAVASLRGLGTLEGYEEEIRGYFGEVSRLVETADLEDAAVLWTYCAGAQQRGLVQLSPEELAASRDGLISKVEEELSATPLPGRRCSLLDIRGVLHWARESGAPGGRPDIGGAIESWLELTDLVGEAPLFPLERFADRLTQWVVRANHPDFDRLTGRVDELLAERHGQFVAAAKCRDRAIALYREQEILRAIKQIHQAKVKWFAEETLRGSVMAMLFLSQCYRDLGLSFASKYHALMAAYVCVRSPRENLRRLAPKALHAAALCDYLQGACFGYLDLQTIALATFSVFLREEDPSDPNSEINQSLFQASVIHRLARHLDSTLLPVIEERVKQWGLSEDMEALESSGEDPWAGKGLLELWTSLEEQMLGRPFSDVGTQREESFEALGVTWVFRWDNTYDMTAAAEQFVAVLQILLADLAGIDLCLLRTRVDVEVAPGRGAVISIHEIPSNDSTRWGLRLPITPRTEGASFDLMAEVTGAASALLHSASLLPSERLVEVLESAFRQGLSSKVFAVERYELLYREFNSQESFESFERQSRQVPESGRSFVPVPHRQLEWVGGPGPGYSKEKSDEGLRMRYERTILPIQRTLDQLVRNEQFLKVIGTLRDEGWLDWHILLSLMNLVLNYRLQRAQSLGVSPRELRELSNQWLHETESENSIPVPLEEFSTENLRLQLRLSMIATVRSTYNLELPHATPDFAAIGDFLGERYGYWKDDIEHPDYGF